MSAAVHTSWAVSSSKAEQLRAPVNVAISTRIGPILHNLVCTCHLGLNHRSWTCSKHSICQQSSFIGPVQLKRVNQHLIICVYPQKLHGHCRRDVLELPQTLSRELYGQTGETWRCSLFYKVIMCAGWQRISILNVILNFRIRYSSFTQEWNMCVYILCVLFHLQWKTKHWNMYPPKSGVYAFKPIFD